MIKRVVRVRNGSEVGQRIEDFQFPEGVLEVGAGEEVSIPLPVYHRVWRRCSRWMQNLDVPGREPEVSGEDSGQLVLPLFGDEDQG